MLGCGETVSHPPPTDDSTPPAELTRLLQERSLPTDRVNYVIGPGDKIDVKRAEPPGADRHVAGLRGRHSRLSATGLGEGRGIDRARGHRKPAPPTCAAHGRARDRAVGQGVPRPAGVGDRRGRQAGRLPIRGFDETIADVITDAGGVSSDAETRIYFTPATNAGQTEGGEAAAKLTLSGPPGSFGPKTKAMSIDFAPVYRGHEVPGLRIPVRGGDVILVPQSGEVYVDGWVNTPGAFPVTRAQTLSEAIVSAGDLHFAASTGPLTLQRAGADGEVKTYQVDYQRILSGQDPDVPLDTGDKIQVASNPVKVVPWSVFALVKGIFTLGIGGSHTKTIGPGAE